MLISIFAFLASCETGQYQKSAAYYNPVFGGKEEQLPEFNTEEYANIHENEFRKVTDEPLSTFSIDVDYMFIKILMRTPKIYFQCLYIKLKSHVG